MAIEHSQVWMISGGNEADHYLLVDSPLFNNQKITPKKHVNVKQL